MKRKSNLRAMTYIALFAVLMAVCAWISIPTIVPFTLQTFAVFLALGLLGGKRGTLAVLVYLLIGAVGLPVFSHFGGGLGVLLGVTGGYLIGFLMSGLVYWLITRFAGRGVVASGIGMAAGLITCYAFGTAWFLVAYGKTVGPIGLSAALGMCVVPFVIPDLVKIALALFLSERLRPHLRIDG